MSKFDVTLSDSFEMGRKEGSRETYLDLLEILDIGDLELTKTYIQSRLRRMLGEGLHVDTQGDTIDQ